MAWENDRIPKHIQEQLNALHSSHQSEIKRLEAEIKTQKDQALACQENTYKKSSSNENQTTGNVYNSCTDKESSKRAAYIFEKSIGFVSPKPLQGTRWNSRQLFGRLNPSPVATVHPQRKSLIGNVLSDTKGNPVAQRPLQSATNKILPVLNEYQKHDTVTQANQSIVNAVPYEGDTAIASTTTKIPRKRKQSSYTKRRTKRCKQSKTSTDKKRSDPVTKSRPLPTKNIGTPFEGYESKHYTKASRKLSVYDCGDDVKICQSTPALSRKGLDLTELRYYYHYKFRFSSG